MVLRRIARSPTTQQNATHHQRGAQALPAQAQPKECLRLSTAATTSPSQHTITTDLQPEIRDSYFLQTLDRRSIMSSNRAVVPMEFYSYDLVRVPVDRIATHIKPSTGDSSIRQANYLNRLINKKNREGNCTSTAECSESTADCPADCPAECQMLSRSHQTRKSKNKSEHHPKRAQRRQR